MSATSGFEQSCQRIAGEVRDLRLSLGFLASFEPADLEAKVRALVVTVETVAEALKEEGLGRTAGVLLAAAVPFAHLEGGKDSPAAGPPKEER